MLINCWAAMAAKESLRPFQYEPGELNPREVEISITHCGLCHSDVHLIDNDWGMSSYPLVPGHEIIGTVSALGAHVANLKLGQRVGVGWQRAACLECDYCVRGEENLCPRAVPTCVAGYGGFATRIRVDNHFVFSIPDSLDSTTAAPLLCGGVTVFTPLRAFGVTPVMRVGVIGIGGLGHLALQFAKAFGCEVTAFSSTPAKEAEARQFGAQHFVASGDPSAMAKAAASLDFLFATTSVGMDWNALLNLLRPKGKLCVLGGAPVPLTVSPFPLVLGQRTICGSPVGGRAAMTEMLEFAARHGIKAKVEVMPMSAANAAIGRVAANRARYRMVLVNY
jgi:uncharacterized zinc-type alcohol dehydrogenase-like protein